MARKKATGKTTRAASAKKKTKASRATAANKVTRTKKKTTGKTAAAKAKPARAAAKKSAKKSVKKIARTAAKKAARRPAKKKTKKADRVVARKAAKRKATRPVTEALEPPETTAAPPTTPPDGFRDPTGGERALLGRGPWWWLASLSRTTPEAPDAADYRRDHTDQQHAPALQPGAAVTPVSLAAAMLGDAAVETPEAVAGAGDADLADPPEVTEPPEAADLPEPPEPVEASDSPEPPEAIDPLGISDSTELDETETEQSAAMEAVQVDETATAQPDDIDDIDELMEAIEALEAPQVPDPPEAVEAAQADAAEEPEPTADTPPFDEVEEPAASEPEFDPEPEPDPEPIEEPVQVAAVEEPSAARPSDPEDTIERLDDELAENVDKMLQGEFESVDELLEGGFDEPAPVDDDPEEAIKASTETGVESEIARAARAGEPPADDGETEEVIDPRDFVDLDEPDAEPAAPDPPQTVTEEAPEPAEKPEVLDEPHAVPDPEPEPEPVAAVVAPTQEVDVRPQAHPPLVRVLEWMNAPRRSLSPPARVIVDWVALSLVFWVPIVWLFAFFLVG
jgi:hypothetical protein